MKRIELDHWFVKENELTISLLRYYINIKIYQNDKEINYKLTVINSQNKKLIYIFNSLEKAIDFTENHINYCKTFEEIIEQYNKYNSKEEKIKRRTKRKEE